MPTAARAADYAVVWQPQPGPQTALLACPTRVYVEEIARSRGGAVMKLMATLRSGAGVPVGFRATGNPGGPGHHWVKARYIDRRRSAGR